MSYLIKDLEETVDVVADWAYLTIQKIVEVLSPDGRPFGYTELTDEEQLNEYYVYRGDAELWQSKLAETVDDIVKRLSESQLTPEQISSVHPMDIAQKYLIDYSAEMEILLEKKQSGH